MTKESAAPLRYTRTRALEHAAELPGIRPLRIHPLAFPLHVAELSATVEERGPFDLLDRYVGLAIADARLTTVSQIAEFLGITEHMVDRVLRFLDGIGHLHTTGGTLALTERGLRSVRDDRRYVEKEERLHLYFDGVHCEPLRTGHYADSVHVLDRDAAHAQREFRLLPYGDGFRHAAVNELTQRSDRADYGLPDELRDLQVLAVDQAFLPCYAIRARSDDGYTTLVYSGVADYRDHHLERIFNAWPVPDRILRSTDSDDPRDHFGDWLRDRRIDPRSITWLDNQSPRLSLPPSRYTDREATLRRRGEFALSMCGSYVAPRSHVLQMWCDDTETRRKAGLGRALAYASATRRSTAEVTMFLDRVSHQLELTPAITLSALKGHARQTGYGTLDLTG